MFLHDGARLLVLDARRVSDGYLQLEKYLPKSKVQAVTERVN